MFLCTFFLLFFLITVSFGRNSLPSVRHYGSRLKAWVHYVPIAASGSDILEKITWLKKNDDLAKQISINGKNFGDSYLRLEDYYCYAARALFEVAKVQTSSSVEAFEPRPLF